MTSVSRPFDRGTSVGRRQLREVGDEFRERRLTLGLSQAFVAGGCRISRSRYAWIEAGKVDSLTVLELNQIACVLGLDGAVRIFPGGVPLRDAAHIGRLASLLADVRLPLRYMTEVPLSGRADRWERRAWDAVISGGDGDQRTAVELEMRLRDLQALERRLALKRRDDPTAHFLLVVAHTRTNRRVLDELPAAFVDLPRLPSRAVRAALQAGRHPGTGLVLI